MSIVKLGGKATRLSRQPEIYPITSYYKIWRNFSVLVSWGKVAWKFPTDHLTLLKPKNPPNEVSGQHTIRQSTDFKGLKLQHVQSRSLWVQSPSAKSFGTGPVSA